MEDWLWTRISRQLILQFLRLVLYVSFLEDIKQFLKEDSWDLIDLMEEKWDLDSQKVCLIFTIQQFPKQLMNKHLWVKKNFPRSSYPKVWAVKSLEDLFTTISKQQIHWSNVKERLCRRTEKTLCAITLGKMEKAIS